MGLTARMWIRCLLFVLCAVSALGATHKDGKLELRGKVNYGAARFRFLRVTLFSIESNFTSATVTDPGGEFHFRDLNPGSYSLAIARRGLGEIRRSVVITPGLADQKGVVHIDIPFSPAEAALSRTAGLVSKQQLAVPEKAHGKYAEAERRLTKHDTEGAIRFLREALAIAPRYMAAWNYLGVLAYQRRDFAEAREYFQKALDIEPTAYEPTVNMGGVLLGLRQPQEALAYSLKAAEARPREALAQSQTGIAYFELGQWEPAEQYLTTARSLDPAHVTQPQLYLAEIYVRRGDRAAAARELQDLLARRPDGPMAGDLRRSIRRLQNPPPNRRGAVAAPAASEAQPQP